MKIVWRRGNETFNWRKPYTWLCLGVRGSGKSSFLEHIAEHHLAEGNCVLDLFGARSGEGLAWLRSEWAKEKRILLLSDRSAVVKASSNVAVKPVSSLSLEDFEDYDIIINSSLLYPNLDSEFYAVNKIIDKLWKRVHWRRLIFVIVREAANLVYSRMKVSENQAAAKAFLTYWLRESRHIGCSLGLDSQRFMAVDIDIRALVDFLVLKAQGAMGLPRDVTYIYRYLEPSWLQFMKPNQFALLSRRGCLGVGVFSFPRWHKKEGEDILKAVKLKVTFEEKPVEPKQVGRFKTISDEEHVTIVELYKQGLGMIRIAAKVGRSSPAVMSEIHKHNEAIERLGYCPRCKKLKSPLESEIVQIR